MENERIKNKVVGMLTNIIDELDPKNVLDLLIERRIVSNDCREKIMVKETRKDRCRALIYHLLECSHNEAFIVFRKALEEHYHWIVERIDTFDTDSGNPDDFNIRVEQLERELNATKRKLQEANREIEILKEENKTLKRELEPNTKLECSASELSTRTESCMIVVGFNNNEELNRDVVRIDINVTNEVSTIGQLPPPMKVESAAADYGDSLFVTGLGEKCDKIWKFDARSSEWEYCNTMIRGRGRHSVAFVDHVLYICGGMVYNGKTTFDDVEAYDTIDDRCTTVGKLVHAVHWSGHCVPFKSSLYIFGGSDVKDVEVDYVQVYDTKLNSCNLLSKPMPVAYRQLRAVLWENKVVLLGYKNSFIYNFNTRTWKMSDQFKTDVVLFGMIVHDGKLFVIGGCDLSVGVDGNSEWIYRDDVRSVPIENVLNNKSIEWSHHAKLPKPTAVYSFGKIEFPVS